MMMRPEGPVRKRKGPAHAVTFAAPAIVTFGTKEQTLARQAGVTEFDRSLCESSSHGRGMRFPKWGYDIATGSPNHFYETS